MLPLSVISFSKFKTVRLTKQYGTGFFVANLKNIRQFFLMYPDRQDAIRYPAGSEFSMIEKRYLTGSESLQGLSPLLPLSHYRALMRVQDAEACAFCEQEIVCQREKHFEY